MGLIVQCQTVPMTVPTTVSVTMEHASAVINGEVLTVPNTKNHAPTSALAMVFVQPNKVSACVMMSTTECLARNGRLHLMDQILTLAETTALGTVFVSSSKLEMTQSLSVVFARPTQLDVTVNRNAKPVAADTDDA
jgi:hypothetical protein